MIARLFNEGDIVRYTAEFLRSAGMYTNVPINAQIVKLIDLFGRPGAVLEWNDGYIMKAPLAILEHDPLTDTRTNVMDPRD